MGDLSNLLNEAAILAARRDLTEVSNDEISDAIERVMAGPEKKDRVISERRAWLVAYHEAGHAIVGALMPDYDPVQKISIIPRGNAGGLTFFTPSEERLESGLYSRSYLQNQMAVALGGRVAEEIIYGEDEVTTGASNDCQQATPLRLQQSSTARSGSWWRRPTGAPWTCARRTSTCCTRRRRRSLRRSRLMAMSSRASLRRATRSCTCNRLARGIGWSV